MHPATTSFKRPCSHAGKPATSNITSKLSFVAASINEQVLTTHTSASSTRAVTLKPAANTAAFMRAVSTSFLAQPIVMKFIFLDIFTYN